MVSIKRVVDQLVRHISEYGQFPGDNNPDVDINDKNMTKKSLKWLHIKLSGYTDNSVKSDGKVDKDQKNTKLRGIRVIRRDALMPLLLYSGSEDRPWAFQVLETVSKNGRFTGFSQFDQSIWALEAVF